MPERKFGNEVERDRFYGAEAVAYIKSHPLDYLRLAVRRTVMTYGRETIGVAWNEPAITSRFGPGALQPLKLMSSAYWWSMLLLGAWGTWRVLRRGQSARAWPLLATLLFLCVVPVLTVGQDRYHVPADPLLAVFAAWGLLGFRARPVPPRDA